MEKRITTDAADNLSWFFADLYWQTETETETEHPLQED